VIGWGKIIPQEEFGPFSPESQWNYKPYDLLCKIRIPVLSIFGENDNYIDAIEDAKLYKKALTKAGNKHFIVKVFPNADHSLGQKGNGVYRFTPGVFDLVVDWLSELKKAKDDKKTDLKGPYLGQKPPGMTPKTFASNIISTNEYHEGCSGFMNGGTIFIFSPIIPGSDWKYKPTYFMQLRGFKWTKPVLVPFNNLSPYNFTVAPNGKTLYFTSLRSEANSPVLLKKANIWAVQFGNKGWHVPKMLGSEVNLEKYSVNYPSVAKSGNIYYSSDFPPCFGNGDIYFTKFTDGKYLAKQNLGKMINTKYREDDPFIAADESFIIFCSTRPGGYGSFDLYISFKNKEDTWIKSRNMGPVINTTGELARPSITPDGKYFFFTRGNVDPDWRDIFWVDAKIIQELKPGVLK